jgi:hypothetical protein
LQGFSKMRYQNAIQTIGNAPHKKEACDEGKRNEVLVALRHRGTCLNIEKYPSEIFEQNF